MKVIMIKKSSVVWLCGMLSIALSTFCEKDYECVYRFWGFFARKAPSYESFLKRCMDVWTNLDLVRAIHTTDEQRKEICTELVKMVEELWREYRSLRSIIQTQKQEDKAGLIELLEIIKEEFCAIFCKENSLVYSKTVILLNRLIYTLKAPGNIKT